jgi:hypothetical protein
MGLYMFQALLADLNEALHKRRLVYCVLFMSVGCSRFLISNQSLVQPTDIKEHAIYQVPFVQRLLKMSK